MASMHDEAKSGSNPLDHRNPLRTGNFNKIVLWVFLFIIAGIVVGIAIIKFGVGGTPHKSAGNPSTSEISVMLREEAA